MKRLLVVAVALSLSGCASGFNPLASVTNPVTSTQIYQADLAYDASLKTFNKYKDLCARRVIASTCRTYVIKAQGIIPKVEAARRSAGQFVAANPTISASSVISAYTIAVSNFGSTVSALSAVQ